MDATQRPSPHSSTPGHEARAYPDPTHAEGAHPSASASSGPNASSGNAASSSAANGHASPADAFKDIGTRLGEVKEYASYLIATKLDGIKATIRNIAIFAVLGIIGLIVGGAVLVTAGVLLVTGLAQAISALLGDSGWAGKLIVSLLILGGLAAGVIFGLKSLTRTFKSQLVAKYEERQRQQRSNFGHDVGERAVQQRAEAWAGRGAPGQ